MVSSYKWITKSMKWFESKTIIVFGIIYLFFIGVMFIWWSFIISDVLKMCV